MRMVRHRHAPGEFEFPRAVVEHTPMAADGPFQNSLPRLIVGFDDIDAEVFALTAREYVGNSACLVGRGRQRTFPHATSARPAGFADDDLLAGKFAGHACADLRNMIGSVRCWDRKILPVRKNM